MSSTLDLTIAIPVKNEEKNLKGCLEAIGNDFARHIIVVDSGSSDRTAEIARAFGTELIEFKWNGKFPKKRNWLLRNYDFKTKWVLFLDADEFLSEEFKEELRDKLPKNDKVGYWLSYTIYFMGEKLKGGYPLKKLALFRVGVGEYEKVAEEKWSQMDMEVHEHPIIRGAIGEIKSKIDHRDYQGIDHYIHKQNEYTKWEASRYLNLSPESFRDMTWKQKIKYNLFSSVWIGPIYFVGSFIFLGGFRDGARGFAFAMLKMSYFHQVYCRIKEMKRTGFSGHSLSLSQSKEQIPGFYITQKDSCISER